MHRRPVGCRLQCAITYAHLVSSEALCCFPASSILAAANAYGLAGALVWQSHPTYGDDN